MNSKKAFLRFNFLNLIYTLAVIVWGAFVRASSSGAGCGAHWPLCNGQVIPIASRLQTAIEFMHRASSGISLILVVIGFFWARKIAKPHSAIRKAAWLTVIAIFLEAAVGAGLVLLKLVEFDQSAARAISIAVHLVNTLFLIASLTTLTWLSQRDSAFEPRGMKGVTQKRKPIFPTHSFFQITLAIFAILGVTGAITALGDTLFPSQTLAQGMQQDLSHGAHFLLKLRVIHPIMAMLWIVMAFLWSKRLETIQLMRIRGFLIAGITIQFILGFLNWMLMAPTSLQLVHLLVANLVFIIFWLSGLMQESTSNET